MDLPHARIVEANTLSYVGLVRMAHVQRFGHNPVLCGLGRDSAESPTHSFQSAAAGPPALLYKNILPKPPLSVVPTLDRRYIRNISLLLKLVAFEVDYLPSVPYKATMLELINIHTMLALGIWKISTCVFLLVPVLTYIVTSVKCVLRMRDTSSDRKPPILPYWLPFVGNLIPFALNMPKFAADIT